MFKGLILVIFTVIIQFNASESTSINCKYHDYSYTVVGNIYYCWIKSQLQILTPRTANIDTATGTHYSSKHNSDVNGIWVDIGTIHYFPRGLENIFVNLKLIYLLEVQLKEIHQADLKPFTKLTELDLSGNLIEIIDEDLFEFNHELEYISFANNKIYHIQPDAFLNHLNSLKYLKLKNNKCISKNAENNFNEVYDLIMSINDQCLSYEYIFLREKIKTLEIATLILNSAAFNAKVNELEKQIGKTKFSNFRPFQNVFVNAKNVQTKSF